MKKNIEMCSDVVAEDKKVVSKASRMHYYPLVIKKGHGALIEDIDGNEYIDLLSSAAALNTGHSHPRIVKAIKEQADSFIHYTTGYTYNEFQVQLATRLSEITPGSFRKKVLFGLSGSDANDGAIKLARAYTGKTNIISFVGSYHGSTYGSLSLSAISINMRRKIGPLLPGIHHMPYPYCKRCVFGKKEESCSLECLESIKRAFNSCLPEDDVAAVIIEPIAGDFGLIVPPRRYMEELYKMCRDKGILFISEEVQQGFGRTGKWFAIDNFNITPDIIVMGKSIAAGMPLSALVAREEIMDSLQSPAHAFTMEGNPICCRAAIENIEVIKDEHLMEKAVELGGHAVRRFKEMAEKYEIIGDVRGIGLSIGVELVKNRETNEKHREAAAKICYRCYEKGVILIFIADSVLRIQPPLVITKEQLDKAIDIIDESIEEYMNGEISDDVLKAVQGW